MYLRDHVRNFIVASLFYLMLGAAGFVIGALIVAYPIILLSIIGGVIGAFLVLMAVDYIEDELP